MTEMSRKYWALAIITMVVLGASYVTVLITEQVAARAKQRHSQWQRQRRSLPFTNNVPPPAPAPRP